jgi:CheY-like chemotaxis protein
MHKLLLVEDESIISEPLGFALRTQDLSLDIAANGLEALEFCSRTSYDLILLDIMMPLCNGVEFLKRAKLREKSPKTKVILMTNLASGKEIDEALSLGAEKSVLKAMMTPRTLIEMVNEELASAVN